MKIADLRPAGPSPLAPKRVWAERLRRDPLLLGAVATCALLLAFELAVTVLQPPWREATDWLRTVLAWPQLLLVVVVAHWLGRRRQPEALSWWLAGGGMACYAIARTWWTLDDTLLYPRGAPFPTLPDVLFVLRVLCYALAVALIPFGTFLGPRALTLLDALLWTVATTAIAWYVFMAPLFTASGLSPLGKAVGLFYTDADLFLLLALSLMLLRPLRFPDDRPVLGLVVAAVACHMVGDVGGIWLLLHGAHNYRSWQYSHVFWLASDLLLLLAALAQVRVVQVRVARRAALAEPPPAPARLPPDRGDLRNALRLFLPLIAALLASAATLLRADALLRAGAERAGADQRLLIPPLLLGTALLTLLVLRQAVQFLELARLRREAEAARIREEAERAEERAQRALNRRKDELLGVVSHELRTPLTSLELFFALVTRRLGPSSPPPAAGEGAAGRLPTHTRDRAPDAALQTALAYSEASVRRLTRLAADLTDDARVAQGRLRLRPEPCDLGAVVRAAVEEQRAAEPGRTILLDLPKRPDRKGQATPVPVPVLADVDRIAQVVANYLTNALKYSREDRPVAVCLEVVGGGGDGDSARARVAVHDEGIGIPPAEQPHMWERFHVVEGNAVQSGSGTSLGLGLHICKAIVEAHGGRVGVESAVGQGSTFWFTLPLAGASLARPETNAGS